MREAIKRAMKAQKVTGYQLAEMSGVPKSVVYLFLNGRQENSGQGKKGPTERVELDNLDAMLKALGLTVTAKRKALPPPPRQKKTKAR